MSHYSRSSPAEDESRSVMTKRLLTESPTLGRIIAWAALAVFSAALLVSCAMLDFGVKQSDAPRPAYPATSFAVFSDPHVLLPELGIGQPAFEKIKFDDRKLFEYSTDLLDAVVQKILAARPRFVIVPGDLSKDGEEAVHLAFAKEMEKLLSAGIAVFVIPGNHDVNNPRSVRYEGDIQIPIPTVTPERFAEIYKNCGYGRALERDPASLAYVVEPEPGLWLLAIDACRYDLSLKESREHTAGSFKKARLEWVKSILERARTEGKAVIAMMHHGVVEHFPGQKKQFEAFVVEDNDEFSRMLAAYGVRVVFTGHFHAQNIAASWWDNNGNISKPPAGGFIYDIETGSLVTYPSPYRLVNIDADQIMRVRSFRIDALPPMPAGFPDFSLDYARKGIVPFIVAVLKGYGVKDEEALRIAEPLAEAAIAHYAGDARFTGKEMYPTENLSFMGSLAISTKKDIIEGMWQGNLPHADNNIDINLADGTFKKEE
jgi:hypothetical protein